MDESSSPLNFLLREIVQTHNNGLFYASVLLSLSLPDVCSAAEFDLSEGKVWKDVEKRYKSWCETYVGSRIAALTPLDIWALRGGMVHQGKTFGHGSARYDRIVFALPDGSGNEYNGIQTKGFSGGELVYTISVTVFCQSLVDAAKSWISATSSNTLVQSNLEGLVRFRPNGYDRGFIGVPVIA